MASPSLALPALLLLLLLLCVSLALPLHVVAGGGFSVELVHRDSPKSPLYDPSVSRFDRVRAAARRSIERAHHLHQALSTTAAAEKNGSFHSEVIPNKFEYLMKVNVGTPPVEILGIADTGSDLTWTNCKPCDACYKQDAPLFDPKRSSTYRDLPCESDACSQLPSQRCGGRSTCEYDYSYGDGSDTEGSLARETFTFRTTGGRNVSVPDIAFGCSHESNGTFDARGAGLVGLGGGPLSLVSQLSASIDGKFSYCLVPYSEPTSSSQLSFGASARAPGKDAVSTPLVPGEQDTFYAVTLKGIRVGDASSAVIPVDSPVIVDSGTTLTLLDPGTVRSLIRTVRDMIHLPKVQDPQGTFSLCFDVSGSPDAKFPGMTFQYSGGSVRLSPLNTFLQVEENVVCLAIVPSDGTSILGSVAQQNFYVGYDLVEKTLTFAPASCAKP